MSDPLLTDEEHDLVTRLGEWWTDLSRVVGAGPTRSADLTEMSVHVHALQNAILAQAAGRAYPDHYRLLGWSLQSFSDNPRPYTPDAERLDPMGAAFALVDRPPAQEKPHEYVAQGDGPGGWERSCVTCGGDRDEPGTNHTNAEETP